MMKDLSSFGRNEVMIPLTESVDSFMPSLFINNEGMELATTWQPGDFTGTSKREAAVADAQKALETIPQDSVRGKLYTLQAAISNLPEVNCPLQHTFAPGIYARTIFIPAGSVLVGKIHKHRHLNILSQGTVRVLTEALGTETLQGPLTMVSEAGTKRGLVALTDVTWTTIHLTDLTDVAAIEQELIAPTYAEYEQFLTETAA